MITLDFVTMVRMDGEDIAVLTDDYVYYINEDIRKPFDTVTTSGIFDEHKFLETLNHE